MRRVVAIANGKGGVGKTTLTAGLAGQLAAAGLRVLVVDTDPQGNLGRDLGYGSQRRQQPGAGDHPRAARWTSSGGSATDSTSSPADRPLGRRARVHLPRRARCRPCPGCDRRWTGSGPRAPTDGLRPRPGRHPARRADPAGTRLRLVRLPDHPDPLRRGESGRSRRRRPAVRRGPLRQSRSDPARGGPVRRPRRQHPADRPGPHGPAGDPGRRRAGVRHLDPVPGERRGRHAQPRPAAARIGADRTDDDKSSRISGSVRGSKADTGDSLLSRDSSAAGLAGDYADLAEEVLGRDHQSGWRCHEWRSPYDCQSASEPGWAVQWQHATGTIQLHRRRPRAERRPAVGSRR